MKKWHYRMLLPVAVFIISCNYTGKLTKRYNNSELAPEDKKDKIKEYVDVDAYTIEKEKPEAAKPKTLFDLTERGQQELIRQAGINEPANDKLVTALTSALSAKTTPNVELIDYTKAEKRVVVSVRNLSHMPADRISKVTVELKIDPEFKLLSCNKLTTEFQTIDLGKLNYSNSNQLELSGNLGGTISNTTGITDLSEQTSSNKQGDLTTGSKGSNTSTGSSGSTGARGIAGKFNASRSFSEEVQLRQRIVALNASISNNTLTLYQESISGIDLTGNILADIVFDSQKDIRVERSYTFSELYTGTTPNTADKLKVKETLISFFNYTKDIQAELTFKADYRHVEKRHRTITESDDKIQLYYGQLAAPKKVTLISQDQLRPKLWMLFVKGDVNEVPVQIFSPSTNGKGELIFHSYSEAKDFLTWLKLQVTDVMAKSGKLGPLGHEILKPDGNSIDATTISNLSVGVSQ